MKIVSVLIYKFNELHQSARKQVIDTVREIQVEQFRTDAREITSNWSGELTNFGFIESNISYTGFFSQGDGLCFDCESIDAYVFVTAANLLPKYKRILPMLKAGKIEVSINTNDYARCYCHSKTRYFTLDAELPIVTENNELKELVRKLLDDMQSFYTDYCDGKYKELQELYMSYTSESAILETIKAEDNDYYENGELYV